MVKYTHTHTLATSRATMCWCVCFCSWANLYHDAEKMYNSHSMDMVFATEKKQQTWDRRRNQIDSSYIVGMFAYSSQTNVSFFGELRKREREREERKKTQRQIEIMIYFMNFSSFKLLYFARLQIMPCNGKHWHENWVNSGCSLYTCSPSDCCYYFKLYLYGKNRSIRWI